jgi:hypothetical protein
VQRRGAYPSIGESRFAARRIEGMRMPWAGFILAAEGFALWAFFSLLPLWSGGRGIREAWDTEFYWMFGVPLLLLSVAAAGFLSREPPWRLALWPIAGHALAMAIVSKPGTDLGLLPLAIVLIGLPAFALFVGAAALGRALRRT